MFNRSTLKQRTNGALQALTKKVVSSSDELVPLFCLQHVLAVIQEEVELHLLQTFSWRWS